MKFNQEHILVLHVKIAHRSNKLFRLGVYKQKTHAG